MLTVKKAAIITAGVLLTAVGLAVPAAADPGDNPCDLAVTFLCKFVPVAPDLDHDVDLTQEPGLLNGHMLPQLPPGDPRWEDATPSPICQSGCI